MDRRAEMPEVSVVIPTRNRAAMLKRAIESVLNQSFKDFELIVVDDASDDETIDAVKSYQDERLRYIRHRENMGGSAARNTGIEAANGSYIAFLDDDDEWLQEKLSEQLCLIRNDPGMGAVYTGYIWLEEKRWQAITPSKMGYLFEDLIIENCVGSTSTVLVRKECFLELGGFDVGFPSSQDWDMLLRIARRYRFGCLSPPLVRYHAHGARITTDHEAVIRGMEMIREKYAQEIQVRPAAVFNHHLVLGKMYCFNGNVKRGRREFGQSLRTRFSLKALIYYLCSLMGGSFYRSAATVKRKFESCRRQTYELHSFRETREDREY